VTETALSQPTHVTSHIHPPPSPCPPSSIVGAALTKSFNPSTSLAFRCAVPSLLGCFSLAITEADDCLLPGPLTTLLPPLPATFPPLLFSLSELPRGFTGCNLLLAAVAAPVWEATLGVPFLEAAPAAVEVVEAAEGGLRTEAADPGRLVTVEERLMVVFGAVGCVWPLTGGEDGRGGIVPVLEPAPVFIRCASALVFGVDGGGGEVFLGTLVRSWQPYPCGTQQRVAVAERFAVGAKEEARDLSGNCPGRCSTGREASLCMKWRALAWRLA